MKNFPRTINNKEDVAHLLAEMPAETKAYLQELLDTKDVWIMTSKLADSDAGIEDATHKVEPVMEDDIVTERYQYEYMEDPNGDIFHLGYTASSEVVKLLTI